MTPTTLTMTGNLSWEYQENGSKTDSLYLIVSDKIKIFLGVSSYMTWPDGDYSKPEWRVGFFEDTTTKRFTKIEDRDRYVQQYLEKKGWVFTTETVTTYDI